MSDIKAVIRVEQNDHTIAEFKRVIETTAEKAIYSLEHTDKGLV
jgi:hypothetical protein